MRLALLNWDYQVFEWFNGLAGKVPWADLIFVFLAQGIIFLMIAGLALFVLLEKKHQKVRNMQALQALVAGFLGRAVFVTLIRIFFPRPRPFLAAAIHPLITINPAQWSFPSAHATIMFAMAFSLFSVSKNWGVLYLALALVSSLSRIIVGVHYPLDIFGGMLVAAFSSILTYAFFGFWLKKKNHQL